MTALIQLHDTEFKQILSEAYKDGYLKAKEELTKPSDWVTEEEVLKLLHIKKSTLAKWRHDRRIAYRGHRGALEYSRADIDRILSSRTINAV